MRSNDTAMRRYAMQRREVLVDMPDGRTQTATLVAWKPTGSSRRARVLFRSGKECTVRLDDVHVPTGKLVRERSEWFREYDNGHLVPVPLDEVLDIEDAMEDR